MLLFQGGRLVLAISQSMLDESVDVLTRRIDAYIDSHAPADWLASDDDEDDASDSASEP
jgi:hypothetical protein